MKHFLILILSLSFPIVAMAQDSAAHFKVHSSKFPDKGSATIITNSTPVDSSLNKKNKNSEDPDDNKLSIEIPPLALLDGISGPSYQIGSEVKLCHNLSIYFEGGEYINTNISYYTDGGRETDLKGYLVKCELKYYLNHDEITSGNYLSLEGFYKKQSFDWQDSIHLTPPYLTTFTEFKSVYCLNVKYGQLFVYKSRIIIDWYVGLGIRFGNFTSTLTPQQVSGLKYGDTSEYDGDQLGETVYPGGKKILPNVVLGFKIGYRIF